MERSAPREARVDEVYDVRLREINGQPGALLLDASGRAVVAISIDVADDLVHTIRAISNPEKLRHIGRAVP
jgi:RNA polymerase sigma-70 factor (ECF subfamily)